MGAFRRVAAARALGDYPAPYAAWASSAKALGAAVTTWPASLAPTANAGKPAARFTTASYGAAFNARKIDPKAVQSADKTGNVYVLAPADVLAIKNLNAQLAAAGSPNNPKEAAIYTESLWQKFGLPDLSGPAKMALTIASVLGAVGLVLKFAPRRSAARAR